jgi:hypothetical protein
MIETSNPLVAFRELTEEEEARHGRERKEQEEAWEYGVCPTAYLTLFQAASLAYALMTVL